VGPAGVRKATSRWDGRKEKGLVAEAHSQRIRFAISRSSFAIVVVAIERSQHVRRTLTVGCATHAQYGFSAGLNERCACFLVTLFRLPQNRQEILSTAERIQPWVSVERNTGKVSALDDVRQHLDGPIFSAEMREASRKVVKAFRVA
jgi:hypothetical protein